MYQVEGYVFSSKETAREAKKEAEGVAYIKSHTDLRNPDIVLRLYNKLLDDEVFETAVGISFLRDLQEHLRLVPYIKDEEIRPIPVKELRRVEREIERQRAREITRKRHRDETLVKEVGGGYRKRYYVALFASIVLAVSLLGVFVITSVSGNNVNILNYEEQVIHKYELWESQLEQREANLREREANVKQIGD